MCLLGRGESRRRRPLHLDHGADAAAPLAAARGGDEDLASASVLSRVPPAAVVRALSGSSLMVMVTSPLGTSLALATIRTPTRARMTTVKPIDAEEDGHVMRFYLSCLRNFDALSARPRDPPCRG